MFCRFCSFSFWSPPARGQITAADADFDGSGEVDFQDFLVFISAFGSKTGDANYNAKFDFDGNGEVDFQDFLGFTSVFGPPVQPTPGADEDRAALVALYHATGGDNWTNKTNWLSDKPLGQWFGIGTNNQGRVEQLELYNNQLSGSIPSELSNPPPPPPPPV